MPLFGQNKLLEKIIFAKESLSLMGEKRKELILSKQD
jgi:hypothetical protein